jgi:hypothetical protein
MLWFFKRKKAMGNVFSDNVNFVNRNAGNPQQQQGSSREILLASNTGGAGPLPITDCALNAPVSVVSTSIDTSRLRRVTNFLLFTAQISLPAGAVAALSFEILRSVDGSGVKVGSTYTFEATAAAALSQSFSFQFADEDLEGDNYTYSVQLSPNSSVSGTAGTTINNATLTVIAVRS